MEWETISEGKEKCQELFLLLQLLALRGELSG